MGDRGSVPREKIKQRKIDTGSHREALGAETIRAVVLAGWPQSCSPPIQSPRGLSGVPRGFLRGGFAGFRRLLSTTCLVKQCLFPLDISKLLFFVGQFTQFSRAPGVVFNDNSWTF